MSGAGDLPAKPLEVVRNPGQEELRRYASEMANCRWTDYGAANVQTEVVARCKGSTYIVTDDPDRHTDQCISVEEGREAARRQDEYIATREMLVIDGYIGSDPDFRVAARLFIEKANANIAGMQSQLYYPVDDPASFEPELTVVYTPNLEAPGYPDDRLIAVDLEAGITRVFNSDYFGESKKGGLRMWNALVYERGGLALHAGCKTIPVGDERRVCLVVGLSGTGKTTTTFTRQNDSRPVQDDFVALMPGGEVYTTEHGCFAKTFGLDEAHEPEIYRAVTCKEAWLENVAQDEQGRVDFDDDSYTQNGRATFPFDLVPTAADPSTIGKADLLLILNRNTNVIPAVARLRGAQAAAYFMLGETMGTSAGGAAEAGKFLRIPGTNPFFPLLHAEQGNRFLELLAKTDLEVYLMNTGSVGGPPGRDGSRKVGIPHSSAVVQALAEGTIDWTEDPDFGYEVAAACPGFAGEDELLLRPRDLYEKQGRMEEYREIVERLGRERRAYLADWPGLRDEIREAVS